MERMFPLAAFHGLLSAHAPTPEASRWSCLASLALIAGLMHVPRGSAARWIVYAALALQAAAWVAEPRAFALSTSLVLWALVWSVWVSDAVVA